MLLLHPLVTQFGRHVAEKGRKVWQLHGLTVLTRLPGTPAKLLIGMFTNRAAFVWWILQQWAAATMQLLPWRSESAAVLHRFELEVPVLNS